MKFLRINTVLTDFFDQPIVRNEKGDYLRIKDILLQWMTDYPADGKEGFLMKDLGIRIAKSEEKIFALENAEFDLVNLAADLFLREQKKPNAPRRHGCLASEPVNQALKDCKEDKDVPKEKKKEPKK